MRKRAVGSWIWDVARPLRAVLGEVMALSVFVNGLGLAVPVFVMQVYDRVVFHGSISTLVGLAAGMMIALAFDFLMRLARARILQTVALRIDVTVGRRLVGQLVGLPLAEIEQRPAASWHALFRDIDTVRNTLSGATAVLVCDIPFLAFFLALMFVIAEPVAWVVVAVLPVFMAIAWLSARRLVGQGGGERRATIGRDTLVAEFVAGRTTIKALGLDAGLKPLWERRHAETIEAAVGRGATADRLATVGTTLSVMTTVAITAVGALAVLDQRLTIGALIAANMLSGRLIGPITQLVAGWRLVSQCWEAAERLAEVSRLAAEPAASAVALPRPRGRLACEALSFRYPGSDDSRPPVLDRVSLAFDPGDGAAVLGLHGIVGSNGSGKTTLLKLLQGLYPPSGGRVLLDGADLGQFGRGERAAWIGYVPQETRLFSGRLRDNIAFARPDMGDDAILRAARAAGLHDAVVDLPDGYATDIGEGGVRLSAGIRQRLALARALLGEPPVLLLDEPSNHLDQAAEQALVVCLRRYAQNATVVVVTHSVALLAACRSITRLDRGRVADWAAGERALARLLPAAAGPR